MKDIVLTRIDDRLIHGQVVTAWIKQTNGNLVLIVDEKLAKDTFMQRVLKASAPAGIVVKVADIKNAVSFLSDEAVANERVVILAKSPQPLEALVDAGISLPVIVLGGMGAAAGRKRFNRNVSASEEEIACMERLEAKGSAVQFQLVPDERAVPLKKLL